MAATLVFALALLAGTASADQTWTYQGNAVGSPANPEGNTANGFAINGTVTFAAPLVDLNQPDPVLSFSFTQGGFIFNNSNSTLNIAPFDFAQTVPFLDWFFQINDANGLQMYSIRYDIGESVDVGPAGAEQGNPGVWADPLPEPGTFALLGLGLVSLALLRRLA